MEARSIREINEQIQKEKSFKVIRPTQLMDQDVFNKWFLGVLNDKALIYSKGKRPFVIHDENEWFIKVILCYLNRNADDKNLTYSIGEFTKTLDLNKGLSLLGNFGIGKTLLMKCIHENIHKLKLSPFYTTSKQLFECDKKDLFALIGSDKASLIIDDLGDEPMKAMVYGQEDTPVASILKQKLDNWETIDTYPKLYVTTNCKIDRLKELYGGRIVSRLFGATNVIILNQKQDFRKI